MSITIIIFREFINPADIYPFLNQQDTLQFAPFPCPDFNRATSNIKIFFRKNEESIRRAYEVYKRMIDEKFATFVTDQLTVRDPYTKKIIYLPKDRIVLNRITPHPPQEPCVQPCEPHELIASSSIQQEPCSQRVCVPAAAPSVELLKVED